MDLSYCKLSGQMLETQASGMWSRVNLNPFDFIYIKNTIALLNLTNECMWFDCCLLDAAQKMAQDKAAEAAAEQVRKGMTGGDGKME